MNTVVLDNTLPGMQAPRAEQCAALTDEALVKAMSENAATANLEKLYERYHGYVYAIAYRILNNDALAEEVVQETFVTLWHKASYYHEQRGSVKHWLQTIAHNCAIDKLRSWYTHSSRCVHWQALEGVEPCSRELELWEQAWHNEQAARVRYALAQLSPEQRQVIELSYFSGYTHVEIASMLQLALGTVKGRMRLGLQKMKLLLQEYCVEMAG